MCDSLALLPVCTFSSFMTSAVPALRMCSLKATRTGSNIDTRAASLHVAQQCSSMMPFNKTKGSNRQRCWLAILLRR